MHDNTSEAARNQLQHDDFHLGNIILNNQGYVGVLDFNVYDWGVHFMNLSNWNGLQGL